jgi:hypothetical protein
VANAVLSRPAGARASGLGMRLSVALALGVWLLLVVSLGAAGAFVGRRGPPVAVAIGVATPLILFFAWLRLSRTFREFILGLDLRLIAGMQAWRWAGFGFLVLYAYKVLPGMFAFPAGLGDMAVGLVAPWMVLGLARQASFRGSAAFIGWNLFGMLDLIVALSAGTLSATPSSGARGQISTAAMARLPLLLIPVFLVPLFLMLHTTALMQSRKFARGAS